MDILLVVLGFICLLIGIMGSFLPVLPGPPISWFGLLLLHLTQPILPDYTFLGITLAIAILMVVLDYVIPAMGTKKFGGSKYGVWGTTIGLIVGIIAPIPFGIIIGPFVGAYVGEMMHQNNSKVATKAAFGSLIGFLTSSFMKFVLCIVYLGLFINIVWDNRTALFQL